MNKPPIEQARDADLRLSLQAMRRAAQRARELASRTQTRIVVVQQGVIRLLRPTEAPPLPGVQEQAPRYGDEP